MKAKVAVSVMMDYEDGIATQSITMSSSETSWQIEIAVAGIIY